MCACVCVFMCVYECMCVYVWGVYECIHVHGRVCMPSGICVCACMCVCVYSCMCVYVSICGHRCISVDMYICVYLSLNVGVHSICGCVHVHMSMFGD